MTNAEALKAFCDACRKEDAGERMLGQLMAFDSLGSTLTLLDLAGADLSGCNLSNAHLAQTTNWNNVRAYEGVIVSKGSFLPGQGHMDFVNPHERMADELLPLLHDDDSHREPLPAWLLELQRMAKETGKPAIWKDGKAEIYEPQPIIENVERRETPMRNEDSKLAPE